MVSIKKALISVSNKEKIVEFAKELQNFGISIISTGGTGRFLEENGVKIIKISEITEFPEMMDGRVKTLHPRIHGGILAVRENKDHVKQLNDLKIDLIDLVVVNLYPFEETIKKENVSMEQIIENIDIGGPTLVRASAKNFQGVSIIVDPNDYDSIIDEMKKNDGNISLETRKRLAVKAFQHTAYYDSLIYNFLNNNLIENENKFPESISLSFKKKLNLRYGENPHQQAAFYVSPTSAEPSISNAEQLQGKELSFNNINDINGAWELIKEFDEPVSAVIKHTNPCGFAQGKNTLEAYINARECDPLSAFGSIVAFNRKVDDDTAKEIIKTFVECVVAPEFEDMALETFKNKKNLRVLKVPRFKVGTLTKELDYKKVVGGILVQERDNLQITENDLTFVTDNKPTKDQIADLLFGWKVVKHVKSNAIILVKGKKTVGIGAGQMSRVDSVKISIRKAGERAVGSVMISDAFFPFRDSIDAAADAGITAIIEPGGSIRDKEVISAANERGLPLVFTGKRCFKH
ncbi:MAG: bifunctional phosphoribosylaminoimidazolecarboxamide formyltransferase/IMP cyclohydrolase [Candidatus Helarchaeota archaeon]